MDSSPEVVQEQQQPYQFKYEPYSPHSSSAHTHTGASTTPIPIAYSDQAGLEVAAQQHRSYQYGPFTGAHRTICGIARSTFILAVILAVVIVVAAVGGGVGGSVAVNNAKKSACDSNTNAGAAGVSSIVATTTVTHTVTGSAGGTATSASAFTAPTNVLLELDCPGIDGTNQVVALGDDSWTFEAKCGVDFNGNIDILAVVVYSFRDCMKACASYNRNRGSNDCLAVEFGANMSVLVPNNFGTCFLKSGTGQENNYGVNTNVGATLLSS